jgi:hypothetical protein
MKKLSIVVKNPHAEERLVGWCNTADRIKHWGTAGANGLKFTARHELDPVAAAR